jgi:hypothetical protein
MYLNPIRSQEIPFFRSDAMIFVQALGKAVWQWPDTSNLSAGAPGWDGRPCGFPSFPGKAVWEALRYCRLLETSANSWFLHILSCKRSQAF